MTKMIENEVKNFRATLVETAENIIKRGMNDYDWASVEEYLKVEKTNMEYFERIIRDNKGDEYDNKDIIPRNLYNSVNSLIKAIDEYIKDRVEVLNGYIAILEECIKVIRLYENNLL